MLIELMVVITLSAVLTGLAISALVAMRNAGRTIHAEYDQLREANRLVRQLRDDAHAADSYDFDAAEQQLILAKEDGAQVAYRIDPKGRCQRLVKKDGLLSKSGVFQLPEGMTWSLEPIDRPEDQLARITFLVAPAGPETPIQLPGQWEAVIHVGRNRKALAR